MAPAILLFFCAKHSLSSLYSVVYEHLQLRDRRTAGCGHRSVRLEAKSLRSIAQHRKASSMQERPAEASFFLAKRAMLQASRVCVEPLSRQGSQHRVLSSSLSWRETHLANRNPDQRFGHRAETIQLRIEPRSTDASCCSAPRRSDRACHRPIPARKHLLRPQRGAPILRKPLPWLAGVDQYKLGQIARAVAHIQLLSQNSNPGSATGTRRTGQTSDERPIGEPGHSPGLQC